MTRQEVRGKKILMDREICEVGGTAGMMPAQPLAIPVQRGLSSDLPIVCPACAGELRAFGWSDHGNWSVTPLVSLLFGLCAVTHEKVENDVHG